MRFATVLIAIVVNITMIRAETWNTEKAVQVFLKAEREYRSAMVESSKDIELAKSAKREYMDELRLIRDALGNRDGQSGSALQQFELARMCEVLGQNEDAAFYADKAIEKGFQQTDVYFVLIRALLNQNKLEDAEQVFVGADPLFDTLSDFRSVSGLLYLKRLRHGDDQHAADHLSKYINHQVDLLPLRLTIGFRIDNWLIRQDELMRRLGQQQEVAAIRKTQYDTIRRVADDLQIRLGWQEEMATERDVLLTASVLFAQFATSISTSPDKAEDNFNAFLRHVVHYSTKENASRGFVEYFRIAVDMTSTYAFVLKDNTEAHTIVNTKLRELRQSSHNSSTVVRRMLESLEARLRDVEATNRLTGNRVESLVAYEDVKWLNDIDPMSFADAVQNCVIYCFSNKDISTLRKSLLNLKTLQNAAGGQARVIAIAYIPSRMHRAEKDQFLNEIKAYASALQLRFPVGVSNTNPEVNEERLICPVVLCIQGDRVTESVFGYVNDRYSHDLVTRIQ